jgi:hypothetical protein
MRPKKIRESLPHRSSDGADGDELVPPKKVTGKELTRVDELSARLTALVELLDEKGIINKNEYARFAVMRLHEISKAGGIEELDEEI